MPRKKKPATSTSPQTPPPLPIPDHPTPLDSTTQHHSGQHNRTATSADANDTGSSTGDKENNEGDDAGDASAAAPIVELEAGISRARAYEIGCRLQRDGRWREISPIRDRMIQEARSSGMSKDDARCWAYGELDRLYPPLPPEPKAVEEVAPPAEPEVQGVYIVPVAWPELPGSASIQADLTWVQAERLRVVEQRGNTTIVRLERASAPAPSMSALGWLETSVRSYAKYIDVLARALSTAVDEQEQVRRERLRMDDIQALLGEMH